ncbi:MAG: galactose mutarotase, partial [Clostridia bacterium]|nr:galactose mutarotase [Clostridia bacterium]
MKKFFFSDSKVGPVDGYVLENEQVSLTVLSLGGIIQKYIYRGKDIVCGFDTADEYLASTCYYGALIGRYCNRLKELTIEGVSYPLTMNEKGKNQLHGGFCGMDKKIWDVEAKENALVLTCAAKDGEEGFPGNITVKVTYTLQGTDLLMDYEAVSDKNTAVNLTNHSYFNLDGIGGNILDHKAYIPSWFISECDELHIPTGKQIPCWGTALDFNLPKPIGQDIKAEHPQLTPWGGYDNNYILRKSEKLSLAARIEGKEIVLEVLTDQP